MRRVSILVVLPILLSDSGVIMPAPTAPFITQQHRQRHHCATGGF